MTTENGRLQETMRELSLKHTRDLDRAYGEVEAAKVGLGREGWCAVTL